jgi:hypothetical protein
MILNITTLKDTAMLTEVNKQFHIEVSKIQGTMIQTNSHDGLYIVINSL